MENMIKCSKKLQLLIGIGGREKINSAEVRQN